MMKALALATASIGLMGANEPGLTLTCKSAATSICDQAGCHSVTPSITIYVGTFIGESGVRDSYYTRCDASGCDTFFPAVAFSGAYTLFSLPKRGVMAKVGPGDELVDVASLMDTVYINRAKCVSEPPPLLRTTNHKD
jgi:hypothetical protein